MEKINLLYDATVICKILEKSSSRSGIFFVAYNVLLEFLKREDFEIYLYSDDIGKLQYLTDNYPEFANCKIYNLTCFEKLMSYFTGLKIKNKETGGNPVLRLFFSLSASVFKKVHNFIKNNFIKIHGMDVYFSPMKAVPKFAAKDKKVKKYTILHDVIPIIYGYKDHRWFFNLTESINSTDKYFANSICTKQDFIKYVPAVNPDNIIVVPLSTGKPYKKFDDTDYINRVKAKYNIPADKKYIFSLCNIDPRKNLMFSIKNFLTFIKKHGLDDFVFVLGGSSFKNFEEKFRTDFENIGEDNKKILRVGYVDDEDMSALYSGAEMFLFPSLYEGFGIPVLEAMQCGLPVICSNTSSLPEVIGDCGIQINPDSDEEMLAAIEKMYFDRKFRTECIKKGFERAKLFTWEKCIDVIIKEIIEDMKNV